MVSLSHLLRQQLNGITTAMTHQDTWTSIEVQRSFVSDGAVTTLDSQSGVASKLKQFGAKQLNTEFRVSYLRITRWDKIGADFLTQ